MYIAMLNMSSIRQSHIKRVLDAAHWTNVTIGIIVFKNFEIMPLLVTSVLILTFMQNLSYVRRLKQIASNSPCKSGYPGSNWSPSVFKVTFKFFHPQYEFEFFFSFASYDFRYFENHKDYSRRGGN
jgi:hypothetical protein